MKLGNTSLDQDLSIYSLESIDRYEKIPLAEVVKPLNSKNIFLASDMDGTMFKEDLGIMVFLEKLSDPQVWERFTVNGFKNLLLPIHYRKELEKKTYQEGLKDLKPEDCSKVLFLKEDLVALYAELKHQMADKKAQLDIHHPLVNEFARKMIEFDNQMIKMDWIFAKHMKGLFLMRTRFFTGLTNSSIDSYVKNIFDQTVDRGELILKSHDINRGSTNQELFLDPLLINKSINIVDDVRNIVCAVMENKDVEGRIVTTNLQYIADKAMQYCEEYKPLNENHKMKSLGQILLLNKDNKLDSKYFKLPVFADRKLKLTNQVATKKRKQLLIALGDSQTNDGSMIFQALKNGGIGVLVGEDIDTIRNKFANLIKDSQAANGKSVKERVLFVEYT